MKFAILIFALIFIMAMMANGPLFTFAWFMTQRTFMVGLICFVLGYFVGKIK